MKTQVQCANCGLHNKASQTNCIKCYASLAGLPTFTVADETVRSQGIPPWVKFAAGGVVLVVLLVGVAAFSLVMRAKKSFSNRFEHFENAIRVSPKFNVNVTEDVGRYSYYDSDAGGSQQDATPAAYKLSDLGLLYIHVGQYSDVTTNYNSQGKIVIDSSTGLVPRSYRHVSLELIGKAQADSVNWESYENKRDGKVGWKVPIGDRELLKVMEAKSIVEMGGTSDGMTVSFTWRWKPNDLGRAFDKASPSYAAPSTTSKNWVRNSFDLPVDDSRTTYWGTADLHKVGDSWEVDRVSWHGTGQVRLSSNASAEIDELIRQSQNANR